MKKTGLIQQGDVLFHRIGRLPRGAAAKEITNGIAIFAYGEATGHHHSAAVELEDGNANFSLYEKRGVLYMEVHRDTSVVHQEHRPVTLQPGIYQRGLIREIDPLSEEVRSVKD